VEVFFPPLPPQASTFPDFPLPKEVPNLKESSSFLIPPCPSVFPGFLSFSSHRCLYPFFFPDLQRCVSSSIKVRQAPASCPHFFCSLTLFLVPGMTLVCPLQVAAPPFLYFCDVWRTKLPKYPARCRNTRYRSSSAFHRIFLIAICLSPRAQSSSGNLPI